MKFLKTFLASALVIAMMFATLGCAQTPNVDVKTPISNADSMTLTETETDQIGLTAGFELSHGSGLVDNEDGQVMVYDYDYYYHNETRISGADPGAWYVSNEDALDSYTKLKKREMAMLGESFNLNTFENKYGTWEYWQENYANKFYVATTGWGGNVSAKTLQKYPTATYGMFPMRSSTDLNNWAPCGEIDGYAIMAESDTWCNQTGLNSWAPEFNRDPITGLYIMCASTQSRVGDEKTEYNPATIIPGITVSWDHLNAIIAISPNPVGPYRVITANEYYSYLAQYNADGTVKTVTVGEGESVKEMAIYRDDLLDDLNKGHKNGDTVYLTEYKNGEFLNGNGDYVRKNTMPLNFQYYHEKIIEAYPHWDIEGRGIFPCIDINPVVDSKGDIYIYFTPHASSVFGSNRVWVLHMKDWVTPDWDTLRHIASPCYSTIYYDENTAEGVEYQNYVEQANGTFEMVFEYKAFPINGVKGYYMGSSSEGNINEGAFMIEKDGWYYFTYSPYGYGNPKYSIYIAISNNPYGPFVKIPDYSPVLGVDKYGSTDYMAGTGHHSFVWAGDELYAVYHCFLNPENNYTVSGSFLGRGIGFDKIDWYDYDNLKFGDIIENQIAKDLEEEELEEQTGKKENGMDEKYDFDVTEDWLRDRFIDCNGSDYFGKDATEIVNYDKTFPMMYGNGPTYSLQPLPEVSLPNGFGNVMDDDDVSLELIYGEQDTLKYANDGMVTHQRWSSGFEVVSDDIQKQIKIKIKWERPRTIRNIMVYNSREYDYGFTQVKSIVFKLDRQPEWYPVGNTYNGFCYIKDLKADPYGWDQNNFTMRRGGSAMADFNEITVSEVIITVSAKDKIDTSIGRGVVKLSEIYIMGKDVE